jgi:hypothetical protein
MSPESSESRWHFADRERRPIMKRFFLAFALGTGIAPVVQVVVPDRSQNVPSEDLATLGNGAYRLALYCSRVAGQDDCPDLQDVNERQLESISKMVAAGHAGVEMKACEWTAFNCRSSNPDEESRGVIRSLVGSALMTQVNAKIRTDGLTVGRPAQPSRSDGFLPTNE